MKKALVVVLLVAFTVTFLTYPLAVFGGTCSYRGYSYSSPSYGYGYSSGYGHGYSPSYYSDSAYYGYSTYYPGSYYWSGGYYGGDYYYPAGYYNPGYYEYKAKAACTYHAPAYPVVPVFTKYDSAFLIARFPSYGVHREEPLPESAVANGGYTAYSGRAHNTPSAYAAGGNIIEGKLDKILIAVTTVSQDVAELKAWRVQVDRERGVTPVPARSPVVPPAKAPSTPPPEPTEEGTEADKAVEILHARCANCHHEKNVATQKAKVTLFVTGTNGDEMASRNQKREIVSLNVAVVRKVQEQIRTKTMPPEKDAEGKTVQPMSDQERQKAVQFLSQVLSQANRPTPPTPRE